MMDEDLFGEWKDAAQKQWRHLAKEYIEEGVPLQRLSADICGIEVSGSDFLQFNDKGKFNKFALSGFPSWEVIEFVRAVGAQIEERWVKLEELRKKRIEAEENFDKVVRAQVSAWRLLRGG